MKRKLLAAALVLISYTSFAQNEFQKVWETKATAPNKWNSLNADLSLVLLGDLKDIEMIDGATGKSLWKFSAKEKLGVKSLENWSFLWAKEGEPVEIIYKKPKESTQTTIYLNPRTGAVENSITESTLKDKENAPKRTKSKTMYAASAYDEGSATIVSIGYQDKALKSAMSGSVMDITVRALGGNNWTSNIKGRCVRHLCNDLLAYDEPEMMINTMVSNGKVFVVYEGITALDLKTGKVLWTTTFDNAQTSVGLKAKQEIGRSPMPVASADAVYICDFSKGEKVIKKLDINTGAELWRSEKLSSSDVVSQLLISNNTLIAKFGGPIRVEKFIPNANGGVGDGLYKVEFVYEGESVIKAYNLASGKPVWSSDKFNSDDKFSKSECSILDADNKLLACSNKSFYILDPANGNTLSKTDFGKEIGAPKNIFVNNDNYIVQGDKGVGSFKKTGEKNFGVTTGKNLFSEFRGDAFIVWTGKATDDLNEFVRLDLETGKIYGKLKGTYRPRFDSSGDYLVRFNEEKITKFKTN